MAYILIAALLHTSFSLSLAQQADDSDSCEDSTLSPALIGLIAFIGVFSVLIIALNIALFVMCRRRADYRPKDTYDNTYRGFSQERTLGLSPPESTDPLSLQQPTGTSTRSTRSHSHILTSPTSSVAVLSERPCTPLRNKSGRPDPPVMAMGPSCGSCDDSFTQQPVTVIGHLEPDIISGEEATSSRPHLTSSRPHLTSSRPHLTSSRPHHTSSKFHHRVGGNYENINSLSSNNHSHHHHHQKQERPPLMTRSHCRMASVKVLDPRYTGQYERHPDYVSPQIEVPRDHLHEKYRGDYERDPTYFTRNPAHSFSVSSETNYHSSQ